MNVVRTLATLLAALLPLAVLAQGSPVVADWSLSASSPLNPSVTAPLLITATPQTLSPGVPPMSIFDYWNSNSPQAQRPYAGTAGWVASAALPTRYVRYEVGPKPGHQLQVYGVSFQYGGAGGVPIRLPQGGTLNNCVTVAQAVSSGGGPESNMANNTACTNVIVAP